MYEGTPEDVHLDKGARHSGDPGNNLPDGTTETWEFNFNGDYVIYHSYGYAKVPGGRNDRDIAYALRSIDELWNRKYDSQVFVSYGAFKENI